MPQITSLGPGISPVASRSVWSSVPCDDVGDVGIAAANEETTMSTGMDGDLGNKDDDDDGTSVLCPFVVCIPAPTDDEEDADDDEATVGSLAFFIAIA